MNQINYTDIYSDYLAKDAIINDRHHGFKEDYLILHCLLRKYGEHFTKFLEIGTKVGTGTRIIKNAIPKCHVYSLDLPFEESEKSLQYPKDNDLDRIGTELSDVIYKQLRGDSMIFPYKDLFPIDGWWIDGEHDYSHPRHESAEAIKSGAKIIIYHDADMPDVYNAITDSFIYNNEYKLFRVIGTRIAYAILNNHL